MYIPTEAIGAYNVVGGARPTSVSAGEFRMKCPKCNQEMALEDKDTSPGSDMRTYRCDHCQESHIVDCGTALWKVLSDARKADDQ